jgi:hypothetical protein
LYQDRFVDNAKLIDCSDFASHANRGDCANMAMM